MDVFGQRDSLETDALYMNAVLPDDLKVVRVEAAPPGGWGGWRDSVSKLGRAWCRGSPAGRHNTRACIPTSTHPACITPPPPLCAGFDAHFSSVGKEYVYHMSCGVPNPLHVRALWCWPRLHLPAASQPACTKLPAHFIVALRLKQPLACMLLK